jgi:hypothetical protein
MLVFTTIIATTVALGLGLHGVGLGLLRHSSPAVAGLCGWTLFLLLCATAWFFKFPAMYLAPAGMLLLVVGWWLLFKKARPAAIVAAAMGSILIAALFAYPFLRYPHLLAYASWGTDQWGYISVAKWLVQHPIDQLPVIDNKPGRDWIWHVLTVKDRPLIYEVLAVISAMFRLDASLSYYGLPAALCSAVCHAFLLHDFPAGLAARVGRLLVSLCIALQPLLLLHLQLQFLSGVVAGLIFMLLVAALLQFHASEDGDRLPFYALVVLLGVLLAGLYTIKITPVVLGIASLAGATGLWFRRRGRRSWKEVIGSRTALVGFIGILIVAGLSLWRIRVLMPESWSTPPINGGTGHVWMQFGALFGLADIHPWYVPDNTPGTDPVRHAPAGGLLGVWLLAACLALYTVQCWRWFREHRDLTPAILLGALGVVGYFAAPPHGSHWNISRALPVFGPALLVALATTGFLKQARWMRWIAIGAACVPLLRAAPKLWPYFDAPSCRMVEGEWDRPPNASIWGALGYAYFYEDKQAIDWSGSPDSFRAMTHYMPEEIRPRLPEPKPDQGGDIPKNP